MRPLSSGGSAIDVEGGDGYAVVAESPYEVMSMINSALRGYRTEQREREDPDNDLLWIEVTTLADPDEELPRRPTYIRADKIVCVTYLSDAQVEKYENEIS